MKISGVLGLLFLFALSGPIQAADKCSEFAVATARFKSVTDFFGNRITRNPFGHLTASSDPSLADLAYLINHHGQTFDALWEVYSKEDLLALDQHITTGAVVVSPEAARRVHALVQLVLVDQTNTLWTAKNPSAVLMTQFPGIVDSASEGGLGSVLAGVDTSSLLTLEREIVNRAVDGNAAPLTRVGIGNFIDRFLFPLYSRVRALVEFNNWVRKRLDYAEELENLITAASPSANASDLAEFEKLWDLVKTKITDVRENVVLVYGQDIERGAQFVPGFGVYSFAERVPQARAQSADAIAELTNFGEQICDAVDTADRRKIYAKENRQRSERDFFNPELKIRHRQFEREGARALKQRRLALLEDSGHSTKVDYKWTETEYYTETEHYNDANGKRQTRRVTKSRQVPKTGTKDISLSYAQIIVSRLRLEGDSTSSPGSGGTITHVYDENNLKKASQKTADQENEFSNTLAAVQYDLDAYIQEHNQNLVMISTDPKLYESVLADLDHKIERIKKTLVLLRAYSSKNENQVHHLWNGDGFGNFQLRNGALLSRAEYLLDHLKIYREQFRRGQPELWITPTLPNYDEKLRILWHRAFRARAYLVTTVVAGTVLGVSSYNHGGVAEGWQAIADSVNAFFSGIFF